MGNNTNKKNQNNKKPQKPIQETLHEQAALRLKAFIEDLRHDPMFRHRLFYPVLYKEIVGGSQYIRDKKVQSSIAEVIYEYYLLKMEKFDNKNAAQIFQAILLSNGPMLPKKDRFIINDADNANSLLNLKNRDEVIHRTRVLLTVLQDENLYNFIFRSTVGNNLDSMRQKFKELVENIHITPSGYKIQDKKIEQDVTVNWHGVLRGKKPVTTPLEKNITVLSEYFEHIRDKDILDLVNFLIYMGKTRNIVTDFSYRPMTQDVLEKYTDYGLSFQDEKELEYINNIENALGTNILQKDLNAQLDTFIPVLSQEYAAICTGDKHKFDHYKLQVGSRQLEEVIKNKLKYTLKRIVDYTRNYITRKMLNAYKNNDKTFIGRVAKGFFEELENGKSISNIARELITYENFSNSSTTDLEELIKQIFKNDISYILEVCKDNRKEELKNSFIAAWDLSQISDEKKILNEIQNKLLLMINDSLKCLNESIKKIDDVERNLQKIIQESDENIDINKIRAEIASKLNTVLSKSEMYSSDTAAERIVESILKETGKLISKLVSAISRKSDVYKFVFSIMFYISAIEFIEIHLKSYMDAIKTANSYEDIINALKGIFIISKIGEEVLKTKIEGKASVEFRNPQAYRFIMNKFISHAQKCVELSNSVSNILKKIPEDTPTVDKMLKDLSAAQRTVDKIANRYTIEPLADHLTEIYFKYYLKPVLINFFGYALDEFEFVTRRNDVEADIISKDVLHFSTLLTPSNVGLLTFDGAVIQDLAKFTYVLMSDTFSGITYNNPDSVIKFLDDVYGVMYFNIIIYGRNDAYVYMNNVGVPYLYRGAKTKIPIRELRNNYDFLMDPSRGLYKNISLPKKKH